MTSTEPRLFVRVDASTSMGIGHFMRCFALAEYWHDSGGAATFIGLYPQPLRHRLAQLGVTSLPVDASHPDERDLERTLDVIPERSVVILDGYHFDEPYQLALADRYRLLVIDDNGGDVPIQGRALLNQNLGAEQIPYPQAPAVRLLGPRYALMRSEFRQRAGLRRDHAERPTRVLINMGGGDEHNVTLEVLRTLLSLGLQNAQIRVLSGPANPHTAFLRTHAEALSSVTLVENTLDVAAEMAWAELAVTAAGTTCLETSVMALPSVLLSIADNQVAAALEMERSGAALYGGDARDLDPVGLGAMIGQLIESRSLRASMSEKSASLVDGNGVVRVARTLLEIDP